MKYFLVLITALIFLIACSTKKGPASASNKNVEAVSRVTGDTITLPSGLKYKIIKEGSGKKPKLTNKVRTHYHGTLEDGTVFDSSYERGEPLMFRVNQVIKGWTQALQLMREGAIWELYIPSKLGYGSRGAGKIPPFSNLIFKVELLEIVN